MCSLPVRNSLFPVSPVLNRASVHLLSRKPCRPDSKRAIEDHEVSSSPLLDAPVAPLEPEDARRVFGRKHHGLLRGKPNPLDVEGHGPVQGQDAAGQRPIGPGDFPVPYIDWTSRKLVPSRLEPARVHRVAHEDYLFPRLESVDELEDWNVDVKAVRDQLDRDLRVLQKRG